MIDMTEKRFVLEDEAIIDNNSIADDGGRQLYWTVEYVQRQKLVDLMNTLAEENKQLKMGIDSLKLVVQNWEALDEEKDGQLDRQNQALKKLVKENDQLKNEIEKLSYANEDLLEEKRIWKQMSDEYTKLSYENEQLNLISNHRGEMVSFATSLIQDMGSEEMLKMWNDFREVMYQKWKKGDLNDW